ncbi:MAG: hypothetical protein FWG59_06050 [Betaproteobacteria bacterium]|nr:hypothetical protein [Betaproteobacteria bacterium]
MDSDTKFSTLPAPRPGQAGRRKLIIAAALALILFAGLTFWLTRDEEAKQDIISRTEGTLHSAGLDPLVDAAKGLLTPPPPPPAVHSVGVATPGVSANGTLIQGTVPSPVDLATAANTQSADGSAAHPDTASTSPPGVMPQQREDSVIRPDFVHDLANWLVMRYKPASQGAKGQLNVSIQAANMRYGASMRGMERQGKDPDGARAYILRYAFNPTMLEALYGIYADRLVDEVAQTALAPDQGKTLNEAQLNDLYKTYAAFFADLAGVTGGIAAMPDLKGRIEVMNRANQQTIALHKQIVEKVFALDEAREKKDDANIPNIEASIATLNGRYRTALQGQGNARAALISALRKGSPAQRLDDDSILFLALWVERRMDKQADALDTTRKASSLLNDLSLRFEKAGNIPRGSGTIQ